jgi:hypothetical protein
VAKQLLAHLVEASRSMEMVDEEDGCMEGKLKLLLELVQVLDSRCVGTASGGGLVHRIITGMAPCRGWEGNGRRDNGPLYSHGINHRNVLTPEGAGVVGCTDSTRRGVPVGSQWPSYRDPSDDMLSMDYLLLQEPPKPKTAGQACTGMSHPCGRVRGKLGMLEASLTIVLNFRSILHSMRPWPGFA